MSLPLEEQQFFRRMYWVSYSIQIVTGVALAFGLRSPTTVGDWILFFGIFFCLGRVVAETTTVVGFWFWRRAFGDKYHG